MTEAAPLLGGGGSAAESSHGRAVEVTQSRSSTPGGLRLWLRGYWASGRGHVVLHWLLSVACCGAAFAAVTGQQWLVRNYKRPYPYDSVEWGLWHLCGYAAGNSGSWDCSVYQETEAIDHRFGLHVHQKTIRTIQAASAMALIGLVAALLLCWQATINLQHGRLLRPRIYVGLLFVVLLANVLAAATFGVVGDRRDTIAGRAPADSNGHAGWSLGFAVVSALVAFFSCILYLYARFYHQNIVGLPPADAQQFSSSHLDFLLMLHIVLCAASELSETSFFAHNFVIFALALAALHHGLPTEMIRTALALVILSIILDIVETAIYGKQIMAHGSDFQRFSFMLQIVSFALKPLTLSLLVWRFKKDGRFTFFRSKQQATLADEGAHQKPNSGEAQPSKASPAPIKRNYGAADTSATPLSSSQEKSSWWPFGKGRAPSAETSKSRAAIAAPKDSSQTAGTVALPASTSAQPAANTASAPPNVAQLRRGQAPVSLESAQQQAAAPVVTSPTSPAAGYTPAKLTPSSSTGEGQAINTGSAPPVEPTGGETGSEAQAEKKAKKKKRRNKKSSGANDDDGVAHASMTAEELAAALDSDSEDAKKPVSPSATVPAAGQLATDSSAKKDSSQTITSLVSPAMVYSAASAAEPEPALRSKAEKESTAAASAPSLPASSSTDAAVSAPVPPSASTKELLPAAMPSTATPLREKPIVVSRPAPADAAQSVSRPVDTSAAAPSKPAPTDVPEDLLFSEAAILDEEGATNASSKGDGGNKRKARRERMARREMERQEATDDVAPLPSLTARPGRREQRRNSGGSSTERARSQSPEGNLRLQDGRGSVDASSSSQHQARSHSVERQAPVAALAAESQSTSNKAGPTASVADSLLGFWRRGRAGSTGSASAEPLPPALASQPADSSSAAAKQQQQQHQQHQQQQQQQQTGQSTAASSKQEPDVATSRQAAAASTSSSLRRSTSASDLQSSMAWPKVIAAGSHTNLLSGQASSTQPAEPTDSRRRSGSVSLTLQRDPVAGTSRTTDDLGGRGRSDSLGIQSGAGAAASTKAGRRSRTNSLSGTRSRSGSNASLRHTEIGSASNTRGASCPKCGKVLADPIMVELHMRSCDA